MVRSPDDPISSRFPQLFWLSPLPSSLYFRIMQQSTVAGKFIPNPRQQAAIEHVSGPMLVLAGAGTGKTTVLVERIAWLIEREHAKPEEILANTFPENAAAELKGHADRRLKSEERRVGKEC